MAIDAEVVVGELMCPVYELCMLKLQTYHLCWTCNLCWTSGWWTDVLPPIRINGHNLYTMPYLYCTEVASINSDRGEYHVYERRRSCKLIICARLVICVELYKVNLSFVASWTCKLSNYVWWVMHLLLAGLLICDGLCIENMPFVAFWTYNLCWTMYVESDRLMVCVRILPMLCSIIIYNIILLFRSIVAVMHIFKIFFTFFKIILRQLWTFSWFLL